MQAIIMLAHKDIEQVGKLAQLLSQKFEVYIHIDKKYRLSDSDFTILSMERVHLYQEIEVNWGGWGISAATILLMKEALKNPENYYFHVISAQDWPARDIVEIYNFYENTDNLYLLYAKAKDTVKSGENLIKWQQFYFNYDTVPRRTTFGKLYHRFIMLLQTILHVNKYKKYGIDLEIFQGPNWMDLPRDAVEYLLNYFDEHIELQKLFMTGYCPDEFWVQTILCNSPFKEKIVQDYHRYILWKEKYNSYPAILDEDDYPEIIKGDYHFIRKVSEKYSADLMRKLLK